MLSFTYSNNMDGGLVVILLSVVEGVDVFITSSVDKDCAPDTV